MCGWLGNAMCYRSGKRSSTNKCRKRRPEKARWHAQVQKKRLSYCSQEQRSATPMPLPRSITVIFVLIVSGVLWFCVLSEPWGKPRIPDLSSVIVVTVVIAVALLLAFADRNRGRPGESHKQTRR